MRRAALFIAFLTASVSALGQDPATLPSPAGTKLLDALPREADIVVSTPDLPSLLQSATKAGLGDAASWRAAFDAQLRAWGADAASAEKLLAGGGALLDAADGETLIASIDLKLPGRGRPSTRATLFAMRSTRTEKALRAAFESVYEGALRLRYEGEPRQETIDGRAVTALPGNDGAMYVVIQDGFLAACDHELALGLFMRGLSDESRLAAAAAKRPSGPQLKLAARHGRGDAAWEGWVWGDGESVQWKSEKKLGPFRVPSVAGESRSYVVLVAWDRFGDMPLLPAPLKRPETARAAGVNAIGLMDDGLAVVLDVEHMMGASRLSEGGGASRLAWLRAYRAGKVETPFAGIDPALLAGPCESAGKSADVAAGEFVAWKCGDEPGRLTGPFGHGPATFLALRCLHDAARGLAPGGAVNPPPPERPKTPLPPPTEPTEPKDH
jgi:hypothetical protein